MGSARSAEPEEVSALPWFRSILTQDLQAPIANAIRGILAPVDAKEQEAQDWER